METFVIRLWTDSEAPAEAIGSADGTAEPVLRGIVRHVRTGTETPFADGAELLVLLMTVGPVGRRSADRVAASPGASD
jgi:hypothetical protein